MKDKLRAVKAVACSDGALFESSDDAVRHQVKIDFIEWYNQVDSPKDGNYINHFEKSVSVNSRTMYQWLLKSFGTVGINRMLNGDDDEG